MSSSSSNQIQITHVINPHLFWFKYLSDSDAVEKVAAIEGAIEQYVVENGFDVYADRSNGSYRRELIVGVFLDSKKKWIRAEVDVIGEEPAANDEMIVWATDYGIPVKTTLDKVVLLNVRLKKKCHETPPNIVQAGLCNIMPASPIVNTKNETRILESKKWEQNVIEALEKMMHYSRVTLHFEQTFDADDHVYGRMTMKRQNDVDRKSFEDILVTAYKRAIYVNEQKFKRDIEASDNIKIKRWLDNNGQINCVENRTTQNASTSSPSGFYVNSVNSNPKSCSPSQATTNSSPRDNDSTSKEEKTVPKQINQSKVLEKLSRMRLKPKVAQTSADKPETDSSIVSVKSEQKSQTKPESTHSISSALSKPSVQSKTTNQSEQPTPSTSSSNRQSLSLAQIEEPGIFNKIQSVPIFVRNNVEEPIESINSAPFTAVVHRGLKRLNLKETYIIQAYAWPNLSRGNSMILVDSQNRGKTMAYLPAICSTVQRELENAEAERGDKSKQGGKMGATAIIVCLTSNVKKIADDCRTILQMPTFKSNVVEAIGARDTLSVTVKLYNGCNILVTTAPCLVDLITKSKHIFKSDRLKCIAFENLDCIIEKHPEAVKEIVKELCSRKSYKGDMRQFIVSSRTWQSTLLKFMNDRDVADSVLVIGNYLEAAFCAGVAMHFRLCKREVKLDMLMEHIQSISYRTERTMIVCNNSDEADQVAKHLESKNIPNEWMNDIDSNYAQAKIKSFWGKIEGILICTDEQLPRLEIKNVQHIMHFTVPTQEFRSFLTRHSALLDFYDEGRNKEKATSTIFLDNDNFAQLPKLVDLLTRDGQTVPPHVLELAQNARMINKRDKAAKQRFQPICNFLFMHGVTEHQEMCSQRHLLLPSDILDDSEPITSGHLRFNVLKIISPTEYIVRPTEHRAGEHETWQTVHNSDEFDEVNERMQAFYKDAANQKVLHTLELGQKCVVQCHEIFYRAEIIAIHEKRKFTDVDTYEVRFVDTGDVERRHAFEIFTLDEQFQVYANQAYHLHLTSIIPGDKEDDWDPSLCANIRKYLTELNANDDESIYEANIVFSVRNTIVVDVMRLIGLRRSIVHCAIKTYLQRRKYGISSKASRNKVVEMAKAIGVKVIAKSPLKVNSTNEPAAAKTNNNASGANEREATCSRDESNDALISFDDTVSEPVSQDESIENWQDPWKIQHKTVIVSQFYNPENFYVVQQSEKRRQLYDAINAHMDNVSLDDSMGCPDVDKYCLVQFSGDYERAKVTDVSYGDDIKLKVFLVDTGFTTEVDISNVYDIPDNLIQMLPFQAIWCNLVGIKPAGDDGSQWTEAQDDAIYDAIDEYGNDLVLHTVSTDKSVKLKISDTFVVRHNVVLLATPDENQQIHVNKMLVAKQLADFDPNTRNLLENIPNLLADDDDDDDDDDSESDWEEECKAYAKEKELHKDWVMIQNQANGTESSSSGENDFERIQELLQDEEFMLEADDFLRDLYNGNQQDDQPTQAMPAIAEEPAEKQMEPNDEYKNKLDNGYATTSTDGSSEDIETDCKIESSSEDSGNPVCRHHLEYMYKRPRVLWWQNDEMIVLRISAHDNVKYGLKVTPEQFVYGTEHNDEKIVAIINFFGCVDSAFTTHEVRGVNVVVRLRKLYPIMWPRLQYTAEKCSWIVQNTDAIKDEEFYGDAVGKLEKSNEDSESDEDFGDNVAPTRAHFDLEDDDFSFDEQLEAASV